MLAAQGLSDYGCQPIATGIGISKAGRILFHTLRNYVHAQTEWANIAYHMQNSARQLACAGVFGSAPGEAEQRQVHAAFSQIGYPTEDPYLYQTCP